MLLPLDEQVVDVALPVGHDDDPCLATPILHGTDRTVALEPPAALLLFDRPLVPFVPRGLLGSGPDAGVEQPQRQAAGRQRDRVVQHEADDRLARMADPPQPGRGRVRAVVERRGVLRHEHQRFVPEPLLGRLEVRLQDLVPLHRLVVEEPIGRLGLGRRPAGLRDVGRRLVVEPARHLQEPGGQSCITQVGGSQFGLDPVARRTAVKPVADHDRAVRRAAQRLLPARDERLHENPLRARAGALPTAGRGGAQQTPPGGQVASPREAILLHVGLHDHRPEA